MLINKLELNPYKSELILIDSKSKHKTLVLFFQPTFFEIRSHQPNISGTLMWYSTQSCPSRTMSLKNTSVILANASVSKKFAACQKLETLQECHPQLKIIHWLQVYSLGLNKILKHGQPAYLNEIIHLYSSSRNTKLSSPKLKHLYISFLTVRFTNHTKHFTDSFSRYAPALRNYLHFHISSSLSVTSF